MALAITQKLHRKCSKIYILVYEFVEFETVYGRSSCVLWQSSRSMACKGLVWEISGRMRSVHLMHRCFARPRKKRNFFSHLCRRWDEILSDTWNIAEIFVKSYQQIYPKRVDIEKKDGELFTKE